MKFSQKIFIMSFLLTIICVNIVGVVMINNNYKQNIDMTIDKNMLYINSISNNVRLYPEITSISNIAYQYSKNNMYMEIYQNDNIIYTNLIQKYEDIKDLLMSSDDDLKIYIKDASLFILMQQSDYTIFTTTDISHIYQMQQEQVDFFIKVSIICSFSAALILYTFSIILTRRMKQLEQAADKISKGNYEIKVKQTGGDEIGSLSRSFNQMTSSVNENINKINTISENRQIFINDLTHEIRTPLTSIIGYSSLIKENDNIDMEKIIEYSKKINQEGKYIKELTDKLMEVILLDHSQVKLDLIDLAKEIELIVLDYEAIFPEAAFVTDINTNEYIESNRVLLKSLLGNVIKNSISAIEDNPVIRIEVKGRQIRVIDYGRGIKQSDLEKIKEPFYTVNRNRNRKISGMGLGISLCMKIVEVHNGSFNIDSRLGEGTIVTIELGEKI